MTTKRIKIAAEPAIATREELEETMAAVAQLTIRREMLVLAMEKKLKVIRDDYDQDIAAITVQLDVEIGNLKEWANHNAGEFAARKSIELTHGTIGYRTGQPRLKTLGRLTWGRVLEHLSLMHLGDYIRQKMEPDKEKLISDRETLGAAKLEAIGVQVVQDETFYVDPRRDPVPATTL